MNIIMFSAAVFGANYGFNIQFNKSQEAARRALSDRCVSHEVIAKLGDGRHLLQAAARILGQRVNCLLMVVCVSVQKVCSFLFGRVCRKIEITNVLCLYSFMWLNPSDDSILGGVEKA